MANKMKQAITEERGPEVTETSPRPRLENSFSNVVIEAIMDEDMRRWEQLKYMNTLEKSVEQNSHVNQGFEGEDERNEVSDEADDADDTIPIHPTQTKSNNETSEPCPGKPKPKLLKVNSAPCDSQDSIPLDVTVERVSPMRQSIVAPRLRHQTEVSEKNAYGQRRPSAPVGAGTALDSTVALNRSQSLRGRMAAPVPRSGKKSWARLKDLSFSDHCGDTVQKFGALKKASLLPKNNLQLSDKLKEIGEESKESKIPEELRDHLMGLMEELIERGKVNQVAVIDRGCEQMVASLPEWNLAASDVSGMVKAVTLGHTTMLKMFVDGEMYICFKHGEDKVMGRAGDHVLVAHTTLVCVVVARAMDDTPGSCLAEVAAIAGALTDNGW